MQHGKGRTVIALGVCAAVATTLVATVQEQGAAAAGALCNLTGFAASHTYVWTGAVNDTWQTAGNWNVAGAPATAPPGDPYDTNGPGDLDNSSRDVDYVCIGKDATGATAHVTLGGANYAGAAIAALDLAQNATLTVTQNSRLWLNRAASANQPSKVRGGSELDLEGATLGGVGNLVVTGTLDAVSIPNFPVTITSRYCDVPATCTAAPTTRGVLTVATGGTFAVDGAPDDPATAGINLEDERIVDNSGTILIANKGYIAADHGTKFTNEAGGTIDVANDFGIFEGRNDFAAPQPALVNGGTVEKSAGTGTSIIATTYQATTATPPTAAVLVESGALSISRSSTSAGVSVPAATVTQGSTYGLGSCPAAAGGDADACAASTVTSGHPQAATVTVGGAPSASSTVQVATQTAMLPGNAIGQAVQFLTPGGAPTTAQPNLFVLVYDKSLVSGKTVSSMTMKRAEDGSSAFAPIPNCLFNSGAPPSGQQSCVDKRGISGVSSAKLSNGDIRMVIRTTQNSRWVAT